MFLLPKRLWLLAAYAAAGAVLLILIVLGSSYLWAQQSSPVYLDATHHLAFKPGYTIPGRSLDAAGEGMNYHFTRFDSYRAPDWKPKPK